jgi:hypothetical protein
MVDEIVPENEVAITVRVPKGTVDRIDDRVKRRLTKIPRHSWLLEAIYEKLYREERVEGVLDIFWENSSEIGATARFVLHFLRLDRIKGGPVAPMTAVGDDSLERYLVEWGFKAENAKGWIEKLKADKSVSIPNVMLPADSVGPYGFKVGLGIHRRLRDGRVAILLPDHPRNAPNETRGDRILIMSQSGGAVEKEATVTRSGEVLILEGQNFFPGANVNQLEFRKASKDEEDEFLDIRSQYILD